MNYVLFCVFIVIIIMDVWVWCFLHEKIKAKNEHDWKLEPISVSFFILGFLSMLGAILCFAVIVGGCK